MDTPKLYEVGDEDPTSTEEYGPGVCPAQNTDEDRGVTFYCTWDRGHTHPQHVAGTGNHVAHVWPVQ